VSTKPLSNQESVDAVWTGSEVVVSWMDRTDPLSPQGRIRRYDASLNSLANEEDLSSTGGEEISPTLAAFSGTFAAFWYEYAQSPGYDVHVRSGASAWTVPGIERFAGSGFHIAALDAEHLIGVWTQTDYLADGGYDVARLYGAVFDTGATGPVSSFRIEGKSAALTDDPTRGDDAAVLAVGGGSAFVAWFSDIGVVGGGLGALVFKEMPWRPDGGGLDLSLFEEPLPRMPLMQNSFFSDEPALGVLPWTAGGTLFSAWEDRQRVFGRTERNPDVVAQLLPLPIVRLGPAGDGGVDAQ